MASSLLSPQTSMSASNAEHTAGRSGWPKIRHRLSTDNCTQRSPAGLPWGMPGIGELMEGAMQQAPQPSRHFMDRSEEHTSELQSLMRTSYAVFCLKKKNTIHNI